MKVQKNKFYILHFAFYIIFIPILVKIVKTSKENESAKK